jgi:chitinase
VKFLAAICGCALGFITLNAQQMPKGFRVAGYLPEYRVDAMEPSQVAGLTDLIVFSVVPKQDGSLDAKAWPKHRLDKARTLAAKASARLLLAVGGWGRSAGFPRMTGNDQSRQRFVKELSNFCLDNGFKGVVYDWEFPRNLKEETSCGFLFRDTRNSFKPKGWTVECAVNPARPLPQSWLTHLNAIHVMSYDNGPRHSTYAQAEKDLGAMAKLKAPANKLLLGLPFYGRQVTSRNNALTYAEIKQRFRPSKEQDEAGGFYFNGPATIAKKVKLAKRRKLAGVMIWEIGQDAKGKDALLATVLAATKN